MCAALPEPHGGLVRIERVKTFYTLGAAGLCLKLSGGAGVLRNVHFVTSVEAWCYCSTGLRCKRVHFQSLWS